jgi:ascorbate PTS system EIIB component
VKIVTICGVGIGSSGILKVNAERALERLGLSATIVAADIGSVGQVAVDAQVILTSAEFVDVIGATRADVIVIQNHFDAEELSRKLQAAIG